MIKKFIFIGYIVLLFFMHNTYAGSIIAFINDDIITNYDLEARKNLIVKLNHIQISNEQQKAQFNKIILNMLIDETLLTQHAKKSGISIGKNEIDGAINMIAGKNNMSKEKFLNKLKEEGIDLDIFNKQLTCELIKNNMFSSMGKNINISNNELDAIVLNSENKNINIKGYIFTSKDLTNESYNQMSKLSKDLDYDKALKQSDNSFFSKLVLDNNFKDLDIVSQNVIKDLSINNASSVFKSEDSFKVIFLYHKNTDITQNENDYITNLIINKKIMQKSQKFFEDLRKKSYINIINHK